MGEGQIDNAKVQMNFKEEVYSVSLDILYEVTLLEGIDLIYLNLRKRILENSAIYNSLKAVERDGNPYIDTYVLEPAKGSLRHAERIGDKPYWDAFREESLEALRKDLESIWA